jgi:uncharacterized membrane protein SpoIIM required for sporulation
MRESKFIEQNKEKWLELEKMSGSDKNDPDEISELFIKITDDLSYASTFYPTRSVNIYLNNLAQKIFQNLYKKKKIRSRSWMGFWKTELPLIMYESRKSLLLAFILFGLAFLIGLLSSVYEPGFARVVLGDSYIDMTEANIKSGDPMAVFKQMNEMDMFLGITINNLLVSFQTFIFGIVAAIGTVAFLIGNGIMLGTFQYFFIEKGLFWESFLSVWLHGTLEISSIVIAGAAGIVMGKGLLFPGTFSRLQSFILAAQKGFKIWLGIVPVFIMAAIIESFLTRYTGTPDFIRLLLIIASFSFIIFYFIIYPRKIALSTGKKKITHERAMPAATQQIPFDQIMNNGTVYSHAFMIYKKNFWQFFKLAFVISMAYVFILGFFFYDEFTAGLIIPYSLFSGGFDIFGSIRTIFDTFQNLQWIMGYESTTFLFLLHIIAFSIFSWFTIKKLQHFIQEQGKGFDSFKAVNTEKLHFKTLVVLLIVNIIILAFFFANWIIALLLMVFLFPILAFWLNEVCFQSTSIWSGLGNAFNLAGGQYLKLTGLILMLGLTFCTFYFLVNSPMIVFYMFIFDWITVLPETTYQALIYGILVLLGFMGIFMILPIIFSAFTLQYFNIREITTAENLISQIRKIAKSTKPVRL